MIRTLRRIPPVKFGLFVGAFYGILSLIIVPFFLIAGLFAALAPNHNSSSAVSTLILGFSIIFLPIIYAVFGGLFGMLAACLYNLLAAWIGGIEFEVE